MRTWIVSLSADISSGRLQTALESLAPDVRVDAVTTTVRFREYTADTLTNLRNTSVTHEFETRRKLLQQAAPVENVCEMLGLRSRQTVHNWIEKGKVLALEDGNRKLLPIWQFDASTHDRLVPGFKKVLDTLQRSPFSAALWFVNRNPHLGNHAPIDLLRNGETDRVLKEASLDEQTP